MGGRKGGGSVGGRALECLVVEDGEEMSGKKTGWRWKDEEYAGNGCEDVV